MARGLSAGSPSSNIAPPVSTTESNASAPCPAASRPDRISRNAAFAAAGSPIVLIQPAPSLAVNACARGPVAAT